MSAEQFKRSLLTFARLPFRDVLGFSIALVLISFIVDSLVDGQSIVLLAGLASAQSARKLTPCLSHSLLARFECFLIWFVSLATTGTLIKELELFNSLLAYYLAPTLVFFLPTLMEMKKWKIPHRIMLGNAFMLPGFAVALAIDPLVRTLGITERMLLPYLVAVIFGAIAYTHVTFDLTILALRHAVSKSTSLLPSRIQEEDLGDAIEHIDALRESGTPPWQIRREATIAAFWIIHNTLIEIAEAIFERLARTRG